jgi:hypothetical protein
VSEPSEDELDRLLARGTLPRGQKQQMLGHILASVQASAPARRPLKWRWPAFAALSLSASLAIVGLWARPATRPESGLREKGSSAPILAVSCLDGSLTACPVGSRLAFWIEGRRNEPGVVTAYADPVAGGERVWYLTNEPVPKAALVGKEQATGRYHVNVFLTRFPVARAELTRLPAGVVITHTSFELAVSP